MIAFNALRTWLTDWLTDSVIPRKTQKLLIGSLQYSQTLFKILLGVHRKIFKAIRAFFTPLRKLLLFPLTYGTRIFLWYRIQFWSKFVISYQKGICWYSTEIFAPVRLWASQAEQIRHTWAIANRQWATDIIILWSVTKRGHSLNAGIY